jgi:hypothetical protein
MGGPQTDHCLQLGDSAAPVRILYLLWQDLQSAATEYTEYTHRIYSERSIKVPLASSRFER